MSDTSGSAQPGAEDLDALRRENAALRRQLETSQSTGGWRMVLAGVLVVLFGVALVPANQAVWLARTMLETDRFVTTFAPLPEDPAVAVALGRKTATSISEQAQIEQRISSLLGSELAFVAAPIAGALEELIAETSTRVIQSDVFTGIWENALEIAHRSALAVIDRSREGPVQVTEEGQVVLDFSQLVEQVSSQLETLGVTFVEEEPIDAAIVLYESGEAAIIQSIVSLVYAIRWVAPITVLILLIGAIWVATDRRRILSWLGIATIIAGLVSLVIVRFARNEILGGIVDPTQRAGAESAWDIVFDQLVGQTWGLIVLGFVAVLATWFFGTSDRATGLRESFVSARSEAHEDREPNAVTTFFQRHGRLLEWLTVGLGVLVLLVVPVVRGWVVLVTALVVIGIVVAIEWIAGSPAAALPNGDGAESDRADEMAGS